MDTKISEGLKKLIAYILKEEYMGYDPYDGLESPIFKLPIFKSNKYIRIASQQSLKKLPFNIRPILRISKGLNPVTLGLCIQSYSYLSSLNDDNNEFYITEIDKLTDKLENLMSKGYEGNCWGYDFDWESRYLPLKSYTPTSVATGFISNSLYESYLITKDNKAFSLFEGCKDFFLKNINQTSINGNICFSYTPFDNQIVYNASMKVVRYLSQYYSLKGQDDLKLLAYNAVKFVVDNQDNKGGWSYSRDDSRTWIDNFHTGYILDCLDSFIELTKYVEFKESFNKGLNYYIDNFFVDSRIPKYYSNKVYPIDSTSAAQSILTLCRFSKCDEARNVLEYVIDTMQDSRGYFYYQKNRYTINKNSYMRWSNAWMLLAISYYLYKSKS